MVTAIIIILEKGKPIFGNIFDVKGRPLYAVKWDPYVCNDSD